MLKALMEIVSYTDTCSYHGTQLCLADNTNNHKSIIYKLMMQNNRLKTHRAIDLKLIPRDFANPKLTLI